jgi:hypothetical protein
VATLVADRTCVLGYDVTGFLLDCWITLYIADAPERVQIQIPVRSMKEYLDLAQHLFRWISDSHQDVAVRTLTNHHALPAGCPRKFLRFLGDHPELGAPNDCFLQTAIPFNKKRRRECTNLLCGTTGEGPLILDDQHMSHPSWLGLEATYLLLCTVRSAELLQEPGPDEAALRIHLGSEDRLIHLRWTLAMRFRRAALQWIHGLNANLAAQQVADSSEDPRSR